MPFFVRDCGGEEIVGFVSRRLGVGKAARGDELRQHIELLDELGVEHPPGLIGFERAVPPGRCIERVPADQHRPRLLLAGEPEQEIGEPDNGTAALVAAPPDRFRQRVIGAVRKRVAVDHEQWPAHKYASTYCARAAVLSLPSASALATR